MFLAVVFLLILGLFVKNALSGCPGYTPFHTTQSFPIIAYGFLQLDTCTVDGSLAQLVYPSSTNYTISGDFVVDSNNNITIWGQNASPVGNFSLKMLFLAPMGIDLNKVSVSYNVYSQCASCFSSIIKSDSATIVDKDVGLVLAGTCPYYSVPDAGGVKLFTVFVNYTLADVVNASYIEVIISSGDAVFYVSPYYMEIETLTGAVPLAFVSDQNCNFVLQQDTCGLDSCSHSESHASPSHESRSHSHSHSHSVNYGQGENCTTPFNTMILGMAPNVTIESYDYYISEINYGINLADAHYQISQAGSNNCQDFNLIRNTNQNVQMETTNPLYLNITRLGPKLHNVIGINTTDPLFNITISYIGIGMPAGSSLPFDLNISYTFAPPYGINLLQQIEGGGAFDPNEMCDVFQMGTVTPNVFHGQQSRTNFAFGYNPMNCSVVNAAGFDNPDKRCDIACCNFTQYSNCSCTTVTLNCVSNFFQYKDVSSSFALLNINQRININPNGNMNIFELSVSDGNQFVPVDFIKSTNPGGTCPNEIRPKPVDFSYPKCCSAGYEEQFSRYTPSTQVENTNDSTYSFFGVDKCPYQRAIYTVNEVYDPLVGISIKVPKGARIDSITNFDFVAYFGEEHMNYYFKKYNQSTLEDQIAMYIPTPAPTYNATTNNVAASLYIPTLFYSTTCGQKIEACSNNVGTNVGCNMWTYDSAALPYLADTCSGIFAYTSNSYVVRLDDNTAVGPVLIEGQNYTFQMKMSLQNMFPENFNKPYQKALFDQADNLLLNIAWTDFFPGDRIYLRGFDYTYSIISGSIIPKLNVSGGAVTSEICSNIHGVEVAECGCINCGAQTSTDKTSNPQLSYTTSPIMFDNAHIQTPTDLPNSDPANDLPAFRRKLMQFNGNLNSGSNMVYPTQVSSNLRLFVNQSNVIYPYQYSSISNTTSIYDIIESNNCGVYLSVSNCSNSLQVWLSPNQDQSFESFISGYTLSNFSCYALIPDSVGIIYPLTPNVYVSSWEDSQHFPIGTNSSGSFSTNANPLTLYQIGFYSSTVWDDPEMKFSQPAYGFEIPLVQQGPFEGVYFYCNMNLFTDYYTSTPLFSGKNICMSNLTGNGIGVSNKTRLFNTTTYADDANQKTYNFHFMASPQCPAYSICPSNDWFVNQPYSVDIDYLGPRMRFPPEPLDPNNGTISSAGVIPYEVDMTFKLNNPQFEGFVNQFLQDPLHSLIGIGFTIQGPIEIVNFLDIDIHTTDGSCANANICQNLLVNSTYNNSNPQYNFISTLSQRVWGDGVKLEIMQKTAENMLDVVGLEIFLSRCFTALFTQGYQTSDIAIKLKYSIDQNAYDKFLNQRYLNDVDYASNYVMKPNQTALDFDGLARRFYFYGAYMFVTTPATQALIIGNYGLPPNLPNSYALYRPSATCERKAFTVQSFCGGVCTEIMERGIMPGSLNISAKAENHPNSTMYDDLVMNSTAINEFLLSIDMTPFYYNKSWLFDPSINDYPFPYYDYDYSSPGVPTDKRLYNSDLCNYYTELVAKEIAVNGSGYSAKIKTPPGMIVFAGLEIAYFFLASTFKTDLQIQAMNDFGISIAPPFFPGVFVDFNNETNEVHVMGSALGLALPFSSNFTSFLFPATYNAIKTFGDPIFPQLKIMFFDMIIPNVTRDMYNNDADLISHATVYLPGPYFKHGYSPAETLDCSGYGGPNPCGPDQAFTVKSYSMCDLPVLYIDPLRSHSYTSTGLTVALVSQTNNFGNKDEVVIPYKELLGIDPNITMRMGNGINDQGILGALPVVSSLYSLGVGAFTYMSLFYYFGMNGFPQNGTGVGQSLRFALYPCATGCPNNATHYLENHPQFSGTEFIIGPGAAGNDFTTFELNNTAHSGSNYNYVFYNNSNLIYNPATLNFTGGVFMELRAGFAGANIVFVANVNQQDCFNMLQYASGNPEDFVYTPLGINNTDQSIGLYMNLRDTLGSVEIFGSVCATQYVLTISGHYQPASVALITFGGSANLPYVNPNIQIFPIERIQTSSELYLDTALLINQTINYPSNEFVINTIENEMPATFLSSGFLDFNSTLNFPTDFEMTAAYPNTDPTTVTLYSNMRLTTSSPGLSGRKIGMKMICKDCWNAFDDATYFDWSNSCNQFKLCSYNHSNFPSPFTDSSIIVCSLHATLDLENFIDQQSIGWQWINQGLTPTFAAKIIVQMIYSNPSCSLNSTINGVFANVVSSPFDIGTGLATYTIEAITAFDGNNVFMIINTNGTLCNFVVTHVTVNYTMPVDCVPRTLSYSESAIPVYSQSQSHSNTPSRNFCCLRNFPLQTFVDPYIPPLQSNSPSHQSESKSHLSQSVPLVLRNKAKRALTASNSHSHQSKSKSTSANSPSHYSQSLSHESQSVSHFSHSVSPSFQFQTIDVCNPVVAPRGPLVNGTTYQLRDEFVPRNLPPYTYDYQHLGIRIGALWLQFSSNTAGVNATSVHMEYNPQNNEVKISGRAWGVWSLPPNRVGLVVQYGLDELFRDSLWYFEITYSTGFVISNTTIANGGVPLAIQELDRNTGLQMNVTASTFNMGYIQSLGASNFSTRISASNMKPNIYYPPVIDPIIESFNNSVQMFVFSNASTHFGAGGWLGVGQLAAWICLNYTIPNWEERYYPDTVDIDMFTYFLCLNKEDFEHDFNDYYIPQNATFGIGEMLFVIEADCPVYTNSESHSYSHNSPSHQSHSHQSHSHHSHSHLSKSKSHKSKPLLTHSASHESKSKSHESKSHSHYSKSHESKSASHKTHSHSHHSKSHQSHSKSHSKSHSDSSKHANPHKTPHALLPSWAVVLIAVGVPFLLLIIGLIVTMCLNRGSGRRNSTRGTRIIESQPLIGAAHRNNPVHTATYAPPQNYITQNYAHTNRVKSPTRREEPYYKKE